MRMATINFLEADGALTVFCSASEIPEKEWTDADRAAMAMVELLGSLRENPVFAIEPEPSPEVWLWSDDDERWGMTEEYASREEAIREGREEALAYDPEAQTFFAVAVGERDGVLSSSAAVLLGNRLAALRIEGQAVARQMTEESAHARKGPA